MSERKRMTQDELYTMAMEKNYITLCNVVTLYNINSTISWEEAMEYAALELSEENARLRNEILRIHQTSVVNIIDAPKGSKIVYTKEKK